MPNEREQLRRIFDSAADRYQRARPDYPDRLYEDLILLCGLSRSARLLEVGCATGKATLPLARRGFAITALDIGSRLAAAARRNLAPFPQVEVVEADFETWAPADGSRFDLVYAATAWHWIDPSVRYRRAFGLLRPGGYLAFWLAAHVYPEDGDPFFREIQDIYDEIGEGRAEIEESKLFEVVGIRQYDWETRYSAQRYIELLETFSGHLAMEKWKRDRLYAEIRRRVALRPEPVLRRHWGAILHVARRA